MLDVFLFFRSGCFFKVAGEFTPPLGEAKFFFASARCFDKLNMTEKRRNVSFRAKPGNLVETKTVVLFSGSY